MIRNFQAGTVKLWQGGTTDKICMADTIFFDTVATSILTSHLSGL